MKHPLSIFTLLFICLLSTQVDAQNRGQLILNQDERLETLIEKHKAIYELNNNIDGFRIQIFMESGNEAVRNADSIMTKFNEDFPDISVYLTFGQPYYRLRVGDFRNRLEAEKALKPIKKKYSLAFITAEKINPPVINFIDKKILDE